MTQPAQQKALLDALITRGELRLDEALALLARRGKAPSVQAASHVLNFLWNENLFRIVHVPTGETVWVDEAIFAHPADHVLQLIGIDDKETLLAREHAPRIIEGKVNVLSDGYCWADYEGRDFVKILGDPAAAMPLFERIRAFTHRFGWLLASRRFDEAAVHVCEALRGTWTADTLRQKIETLEQEYGTFECFDRVVVDGVYAEGQVSVNISNQMKLPKGVTRAQRRGEARFELVSVSMPCGVSIHRVDVRIAIIEEARRFRICLIEFIRS